MRSFELPGSLLFVQPLRTEPGAPLYSRTHSTGTYKDDSNLFCPDTRVLRLWPFRAALAFGEWQVGPDDYEIAARKADEKIRSDWNRYNAVNDRVDYEDYYRTRVGIALDWDGSWDRDDDELIMSMCQERLERTHG